MTAQAVDALRDEVSHVTAVLSELSEAEWDQPSACAGWTVQDLVAHLASGFDSVVNPGSGPAPEGDEPFTEPAVRARRGRSPSATLDEYQTLSEQALTALAGLQEPPMADMEIPIATLGNYPLHLVANALAFDHYCHLRYDLLAPHGPVAVEAPPDNDAALGATVEWLLAGLPQMNRDTLNAEVTKPVVLELRGPGGGIWTMAPVDGGFEVVEGADAESAGTVRSSTADFIRWSTTRASWRDLAETEGDDDYLATVLDKIDLE